MKREEKRLAIAALIILVFIVVLKIVDTHVNFKGKVMESIYPQNIQSDTGNSQ